jgi:hypothetical protein
VILEIGSLGWRQSGQPAPDRQQFDMPERDAVVTPSRMLTD